MIYFLIYITGVLFSLLRANASLIGVDEIEEKYEINSSLIGYLIYVYSFLSVFSWIGFFILTLVFIIDKETYFFKFKPYFLWD